MTSTADRADRWIRSGKSHAVTAAFGDDGDVDAGGMRRTKAGRERFTCESPERLQAVAVGRRIVGSVAPAGEGGSPQDLRPFGPSAAAPGSTSPTCVDQQARMGSLP